MVVESKLQEGAIKNQARQFNVGETKVTRIESEQPKSKGMEIIKVKVSVLCNVFL